MLSFALWLMVCQFSLLVLQLDGIIEWSWYAILSPTWVPAVLVAAAITNVLWRKP